MIVHDVEQGSPEWHALRCGVPTASRMSEIITPTGKPSASSKKYLAEKLAEWLSGKRVNETDPTDWMKFGKEKETEAREAYSFIEEVKVE